MHKENGRLTQKGWSRSQNRITFKFRPKKLILQMGSRWKYVCTIPITQEKKMAVHTENQFEIKWGKVLFQLFTRNVQCIL